MVLPLAVADRPGVLLHLAVVVGDEPFPNNFFTDPA